MAVLPKRRDRRPLESAVEAKIVQHGKDTGWRMDKFKSIQHRSVPDRMCLHDFGTIVFIEVKRLGEKPTDLQIAEHRKLRLRGFAVHVVDNVEAGVRVLDFHNPYLK